ncbi:hypothetical protein V6N13_048739 [Hibiscus sabdariffa]
MAGNQGTDGGNFKSVAIHVIISTLLEERNSVEISKLTVDPSTLLPDVEPVNNPFMRVQFPSGLNIGPLNVNLIPIMDVDMGIVGEENPMLQSKGLKRP